MVWAYSGIANDDATTGVSENCHAVRGVSQRKPLKPSEWWGANLKVEESSTAQACFSEALEHPQGTLQFSDH